MCVAGPCVEPTPRRRDAWSERHPSHRPRPTCFHRFTTSAGTAWRGTLLSLGILGVALAAAGCGAAAADEGPPPPTAAPTVTAPAPVVPVAPGEKLAPGERTPDGVARALRAGRVVVVGFLLPGVADDVRVGAALARVEKRPGSGDVRVFAYRVTPDQDLGDLPELLAVEGTPTVAVIGRDGRLSNVFRGVVDVAILTQAVADARATEPEAKAAG